VQASERSHPELEGRAVIVTGGTRGIGLGIVRVLARSGVQLMVTGRKPERLERVAAELRALGAPHRTMQADHADPASSRAVVEQAALAFGRIDGLVAKDRLFRQDVGVHAAKEKRVREDGTPQRAESAGKGVSVGAPRPIGALRPR